MYFNRQGSREFSTNTRCDTYYNTLFLKHILGVGLSFNVCRSFSVTFTCRGSSKRSVTISPLLLHCLFDCLPSRGVPVQALEEPRRAVLDREVRLRCLQGIYRTKMERSAPKRPRTQLVGGVDARHSAGERGSTTRNRPLGQSASGRRSRKCRGR